MTTLQEAPQLAPVSTVDVDDQPRRLTSRTVDDVASLVGGFFGSLALTWVFFEKILTFSGAVGFAVCWWIVFVLLYMGVTALSNPIPAVIDRAVVTIVTSGAAVVGAVIVWVILFPFVKGWPALSHLNFYTHDMAGIQQTAPFTQGGILAAIVGTLEQVGIATAISLPLGVATSIYLSEVGGRVAKIVRTVVEAMTALPDIIAGLFVYTFFVLGLGWDKDGLSVAVALAVTMTPIVARSAEVVLRVVPHGLREASWALGASKWSTVRRVVLPTARAGLATSLILGIARVAGETAPLLIVNRDTTIFNGDPRKNGQSSLPQFAYFRIKSGLPNAEVRGYATGAVLLAIVLALFVTARLISRDRVGGGRRRRFAFGPRPSAPDPLSPFPPPAPGEGPPQAEEPPDPPHWDIPDVTMPFEPIQPEPLRSEVNDPSVAEPWHQQLGKS